MLLHPDRTRSEIALSVRFQAKSDVGSVRTNNEDAWLADAELGLFVVCDGLGGHVAGEVASNLATATLEEQLSDSQGQPDEELRTAILEANSRIKQDQDDHPERRGMGTTVTALWIPTENGAAWIGHVGDSRIYCLREGQLTQLTDDHSPIFRLYRTGQLSKDDLRQHPQKNLIERSLGQVPELDVDLLDCEMTPGDLCLLCSDGLSDYVSDAEIREILNTSPWEEVAETLVDAALAKGGFDNITVVLVQVQDS